MRFSRTLGMLILACAVLCAAGPAFAQKSTKKKAAAPPDDKAATEAMMKAATPGPEHKMLMSMVGTWKTSSKMWFAPGAPATEATGESTITSMLGGRFIQENFKSEMMGMPFEGFGTTGYDNVQKKYVGTWSDNFGTGIMSTTGTYDAGTKTFTYTAKYPDPVTGKWKSMKIASKEVDANTQISEFWDEMPGGKLVKIMEITYTRQ